jgi:hypothetical protein
MNDSITSLARTIAPILAGAIISWLLTLGIDVDPQAQASLIIFITALIQAAYYALVRSIEPHLPVWLRRALLGSAKQPTYPQA